MLVVFVTRVTRGATREQRPGYDSTPIGVVGRTKKLLCFSV